MFGVDTKGVAVGVGGRVGAPKFIGTEGSVGPSFNWSRAACSWLAAQEAVAAVELAAEEEDATALEAAAAAEAEVEAEEEEEFDVGVDLIIHIWKSIPLLMGMCFLEQFLPRRQTVVRQP